MRGFFVKVTGRLGETEQKTDLFQLAWISHN